MTKYVGDTTSQPEKPTTAMRKICTPSELIYQAFELIYTPSSEVLLVGELMS